MGSKGRIPPPQLRRPPPSHHDPPFGHPPMRGPPFPPYDMLPPPHELMEQKLAAQQVDMQRVATENQRLAATHGALRQELAASQHEVQMINSQTAAGKADAEQRIRGVVDNIAKTEADLKAVGPLKSELQKAHLEAHKLSASRQELIGKVQVLSTDIQRAHMDAEQNSALKLELERLRQEYQHCRATYDFEKKFYNDHLEGLKVMENNYMNMAREFEKLRGELMNSTYADRRPDGVSPFGVAPGGNETDASGLAVGQNAYDVGYSALQARAPPPPPAGSAVANAPIAAGNSGYAGAQPGPAPARPGYDPASGTPIYDSRGNGHGGYVPNYDPQRGSGYEVQRGGPGYDPSRPSTGYDAQSRGASGPHGHVPSSSGAPYVSATPPQPARGGNNAVRK